MQYFSLKFLLYSFAEIWQREYIVMKTKVGSTKIVNVMESFSLFPDIGHTHWIHCNNQGRVYQNFKLHVMSSKRKYNSMMCINIHQLFDIVFYDRPCIYRRICKYETFWQKVSVESLLLRWPLRPVGLLFISTPTIYW